MSGVDPRPEQAYAQRAEAHEALRDKARASSLRLQTGRVVTFLGAAAALVLFDVLEGAAESVMLGVALVLVAVFIGLVVVHRRVRNRQRWHEALRALAAEGSLRLDRRWEELEVSLPDGERRAPPTVTGHGYAVDLDLFGPRSLSRLLGPVTSPRGATMLEGWLLAPADPDEVLARQQACAELAPDLDFRHELAAHGRVAPARDEAALQRFLRWAEGDPWILREAVVRWAAWLLPAANGILLSLDVFGGWGPWWIPTVLMQFELLRRVRTRIVRDFGDAEEGAAGMQAYVHQLRLVAGRAGQSALLAHTSRAVGSGDSAAPARLQVLARLLDTVESRRNMVFATLAIVALAEVHLAVRLDRWRARSGANVSEWLRVLATTEALSALASLAHDHPGWCYPEWTPESGRVRAQALGHPLLGPGECVPNDVELGPEGTFLLVTGSNMSGKSTLLRAVGANVVLAGAGGPVCAVALSLPPVRLMTSMRISDDVTRGVSLFMAELLRVRDVVDEARATDELGRPVLYLLDEMLHGTNTAERRVAARAVLRHLLEVGALGAVSTHDLTLADAPDLEERAHAVHFREEVLRDQGRTRLTFDYRLRSGLATTRNALRLLEAVGLEVPEDEAGSD